MSALLVVDLSAGRVLVPGGTNRRGEGLMTADEWAGEDYQRQRPKGWCPFIVAGLVALLVTSFRLAALALDKACR